MGTFQKHTVLRHAIRPYFTIMYVCLLYIGGKDSMCINVKKIRKLFYNFIILRECNNIRSIYQQKSSHKSVKV